MTKYAILNPLNGSYNYVSTETERDALLAQLAWDSYLAQTHNAPYSIINVKEDGAEEWFSPSGVPQLTPAQFEAQLLEWEANILNIKTNDEMLVN